MKQLFLLVLIMVGVGCGSSQKFPVSFFQTQTVHPTLVIDSLNQANRIQAPLNLDSWSRKWYLSSDSVQVTSYLYITRLKDTTYVYSALKNDSDSTYLIRFRKE